MATAAAVPQKLEKKPVSFSNLLRKFLHLEINMEVDAH